MDHLLGMWHYPRSYGLVDIKREVKVEGMVTGLKQLIREMRLSLMKPQHLLLFHSQWHMGLYTCGLRHVQMCSGHSEEMASAELDTLDKGFLEVRNKLDVEGRDGSDFHKKRKHGGFPGGAVVEGLPASAGDMGLSLCLGGSHMPQSTWAHAPQLLKPAHLGPVLHNRGSHRNEE